MLSMRTRVLVSALIVATAASVVVALLLLGRGTDVVPRPGIPIEQALAGFVRDRFGTDYVGPCPQELPHDGDIPRGMCSRRFSGTDGRAVYGVGPPFSEWVGEATLVRDASGSWRVASFDEYPPLGASPAGAPWEGPPPPDPSGAVSVAEFAEYLTDAAPAWTDSPARMALEFLDVGDPAEPDHGAFTTTVVQEADPEGGERSEVTVTLEGLLDDSIHAVRYRLEFRKDASGAWELVSARWAQRCAPGRGHQRFDPDPCV